MTAVPRALNIGLQVPARGTRPAGQQLLERPKRIRPTITAMGIGVEVQLAHQRIALIALFVLFTVRRMDSEGLLKRVSYGCKCPSPNAVRTAALVRDSAAKGSASGAAELKVAQIRR